MKLILDLTEEEKNKLSDALTEYWDEGPEGEGWASGVLKSLRVKVEEAIKKNNGVIDNAAKA